MRFLYGANPVLEALRAHPGDIKRILLERGKDGRRSPAQERVAEEAKKAGLRVEEAHKGELQRRTNGGVHNGIGAELAEFGYVELQDVLDDAEASGRPAFLLILDQVTDPQNFGALVRSAHSLGAHGVIVPKDRSADVTPAAAKAAAGAFEHCKIAQVVNISRTLEELKEQGVWTVALAGEGKELLSDIDLTSPIALVLGAEGSGVRPLVQKTCDHIARIPLAGQVSSLNVSAAGAIALYEVVRQRA
ncbi:MAG: 23S rRNA (guanosine(2251)-2'-O)-methyltransferase RlmB [Deltaproteobacteria bacterium]|nr:23S rRNA (guanosine(2251)-2'-O)-methyltransferase RlmB [Deltaproteobacteria bacterium]